MASYPGISISLPPETYLGAEQLGAVYAEYQPTFPIPGGFINSHHRFLSTAINPTNGAVLLRAPGLLEHSIGIEINGWLRTADALKLYELAYHCNGPILKLGTYKQLTTFISPQALIAPVSHSPLIPF